ncbi:MAG: Rdx family protein [Gemmatimonadota bacterium]
MASGLEARIHEEFPALEVELIRSSGGVFDISLDGELIFSKKKVGRHALWEEIRERLKGT